ncbi:hypothetical protein [Geomicrobium sp. JCM 19055]|uniref:hypothetical protein n=1 Tax=Geomicrobium sp. JCM 19055 TaxID=1460649 RepID=UPI00045ED472|nr:hypothetical protein [Geomicrobium sp. JCM 19055]GAK00865.1 hypothetical protein JCM19055_3983 [Geomicrobium sp. JCM 19055]
MPSKNINIKLDLEKDADIIEFLEDKPATFFFKESMRRYMPEFNTFREEKGIHAVKTPSKPTSTEDEIKSNPQFQSVVGKFSND